MTITRRQIMGLGAGALVASGLGLSPSFATSEASQKAIMAFAGDTSVGEGRIELTTPEIAENGNSVPISFSVDSPMSESDHVVSVMLLAEGNPSPEVVTFNFTAASGVAKAKTRIRLAKTQNVVAVAKMSDGSIFMTKNQVKVTIGGCGG
ncbi:MAG: thiosulfate oxidation carrier protein SoxY [Rhizobiaceae bacterium]